MPLALGFTFAGSRTLSTSTPDLSISRAVAAIPLETRPAGSAGLQLVRLGADDLDAVVALFRRRQAWMVGQGIDQWRDEHRDQIVARLSGYLTGGEGPSAIQGANSGAEFGSEFGSEFGAMLGARTADGDLCAAVAVCGDEPIWAGVPVLAAAAPWYLEKLMSDPDAPAGAGAALLAGVAELARQVGVDCMRMDCMADSRALRRFWQSRGFLPLCEVRHGSGMAVLLHERRLGPPAASVLDQPFDDAVRATLLFVVRAGRVLLIHKKRGHGAGKINGPGGKCEPGESPRACAVREVAEELLIDVADPEYRGELRFTDSSGERIHGFVFVSDGFSGVPTETDEAIPEWFALADVPYGRMWGDDRMWLPWVLEGEGIRGAYGTHNEEIVSAELRFGAGVEPD